MEVKCLDSAYSSLSSLLNPEDIRHNKDIDLPLCVY